MLKGKSALVTGSTSGIGLGIARSLARQGADILLNGFGDVEGAKAQLGEFNVKVSYHGADMSKPAEIEDLMRLAKDELGGLDIVVNNAGIQHVAAVEHFPVERWDAVIAINLTSAFHTTRLALPSMLSKGWGRIINVASAHGLVASAQKSAYVAAKHGLVGFTKSVALETATTGVTVNAICPGWVLTPLVQNKWMRVPNKWGSTMRQPHGICWLKSSPLFNSPRQNNSVNWPCFCARRRPTTFAVQPSMSMAVGWRSNL